MEDKKSFNPVIVVVFLVILGIAAFVMLKPQEQMVTETKVTTTEEVKEFTLEAGSFYYKPNVITVKKGDKVRVTINSVSMMHDFVIDEFNVKSETVPSGQTKVVEFTADKAGSFEFYCSVGQHRANGQVGVLTVTEE